MNGLSILTGIGFAFLASAVAFVTSESVSFATLVLLATGAYAYFGFKKIEIGHKGVLTVLGARAGIVFGEGLLWLPKGLAGVIGVDVRKRGITLDMPNIQSADDLDIEFLLTAVVSIKDPIKFLDLQNPWGTAKEGAIVVDGPVVGELDEALREVVSRISANPATGGNRITAARRSIEKGVGVALQNESQLPTWGLLLESLQIGDINLPIELQSAVTKKRVEEQQRESEKTEIETVAILANTLQKQTRLPIEECMRRSCKLHACDFRRPD